MLAQTMRKLRLLLPLVLSILPAALHAADQPPIEVDSQHFHLITTAGEKQARHILDNFEHMRWVFATLFPKANIDPPTPILVFAAKNKREFDSLEPSAYLEKGALNLAGYFLAASDNNFILLRLDAEQDHPFATVYHEYTHLQFRSAGDWMPLWLNEGIAEFFQNTDFHDKQVTLGEPSGDDILYLRQHPLIPLPTLLRVDHDSPYYHQENKGSVFYAESWALTHYLQVTDRQSGTHRLSDYLLRMSRHEDPVEAAQAAFGDLKKLQSDLSLYIQQSQYKQFVLNSAAAPIDPATYTVHPLPQAQFDAYRAEFLAYVGRTAEAKALAQSISQADPKSALAQETMGYLAFREGNHGAARDAYGKAVELDSGSYLAHYYFTALSMEMAGGDPKIEASLRKAISLNPRFAPSYDLLAQLCSRQPEKLDEAQKLELSAIQLDPSNINYRFNAASLLQRRGKPEDAIRVLEAARPLARNQGSSGILEARLQQVREYESSRAPSATTSVSAGSTTEIAVIQSDHAEPIPSEPPSAPATGPSRQISGTIHSVRCSGTGTLEFTVDATPKPLVLYTRERASLDLTASGVDAPDNMDLCTDLNGYRAQIQYAETPGKTIDGQIIAIVLQARPNAPPALKHPTEPATGRKHQVSGLIRSVSCYGDASLDITVQLPTRPNPLVIYTNDRINMDLTAFGFTPSAPINPCTSLVGYRADFLYAESSDKSIDGQIIAVMLRKQPAK